MTHRDEALRILEEADRDVSENWLTKTGEEKADMIAQAQVHALLEIGEQLRVANDLRRVQVRLATGYNFAKELFEDTGHPYLDSTSPQLKPEIVEMLHIPELDQ